MSTRRLNPWMKALHRRWVQSLTGAVVARCESLAARLQPSSTRSSSPRRQNNLPSLSRPISTMNNKRYLFVKGAQSSTASSCPTCKSARTILCTFYTPSAYELVALKKRYVCYMGVLGAMSRQTHPSIKDFSCLVSKGSSAAYPHSNVVSEESSHMSIGRRTNAEANDTTTSKN